MEAPRLILQEFSIIQKLVTLKVTVALFLMLELTTSREFPSTQILVFFPIAPLLLPDFHRRGRVYDSSIFFTE